MIRILLKMKTACCTAVSRRGVRRSSNASDIQRLDKNRLQFLALCFLCVLLCSCSAVTGQRKPDGTIIVTQWRLLWKSEAVNVVANYAATNFNLQVSVGKSASDDASVGAVTEGAVRAITRP